MSAPVFKRFIFTALACEAKPFIAALNLKKDNASHPFALYTHQETVLVVSGCGKVAMAAAVAYGMAYCQVAENPVLINVGIAGHQTASVGTLFAVHKISDAETGKHFYPQLLVALPCLSESLQTVSNPETEYTHNSLYDMESSGFYEIASRFTSAELIVLFKVVSDNRQASIELISADEVTRLIATQTPTILQGLENLAQLTQPLIDIESIYYQPLLEQCHFTLSTKLQLKALLQRWAVLTDNAALILPETPFKHSKAVLLWLENQLANLRFSL